MKTLAKFWIIGTLFVMAGCASSSDEIPAAYVSPLTYSNYTCDQIRVEMNRLRSRVSSLGGVLDKKASGDDWQMDVGLVLFWPTLFFLDGDGPEAAEYARIKGEPIKTEEEWLGINQDLVFGTLEPFEKIDRDVAFGDIQLSYKNEPFGTVLDLVAAQGTSVAAMDNVPELANLSPWTRAEAARLLAAGGQVMCFAEETSSVKVPKGAKLSMPAVNRGMIKELGLAVPRIALAAPNAGLGVELANIDAILLLARCDKGLGGAVAMAGKVLAVGEGDVVIGGKTLKPKEVEALLAERLKVIEDTMLDKLAEIGVVSVEG